MSVNSRSRNQKQIQTIIITALLSALGYLLMMLGKIIPFGTFSFLEVEISDLTIVLAYSLAGFLPSIAVAIIKTLLNALTFGFVGVPIPIGQIAALISSSLYAVLILIADKIFNFASRSLIKRIFSYVIITLFVAAVLSFLNYLFITPTFLTYGSEFLTYFDIFSAEENSAITQTLESYFGAVGTSYTAAIFIIYIPFNALKGVLIFIIFEILIFKALPHLEKVSFFKVKLIKEKRSLLSFRKLKINEYEKTNIPLFEQKKKPS